MSFVELKLAEPNAGCHWLCQGPRGKNILNCEDAVEIRVIGQLVLWNDEFQINGRSPRQGFEGERHSKPQSRADVERGPIEI